jgi:hypothetical protein
MPRIMTNIISGHARTNPSTISVLPGTPTHTKPTTRMAAATASSPKFLLPSTTSLPSTVAGGRLPIPTVAAALPYSAGPNAPGDADEGPVYYPPSLTADSECGGTEDAMMYRYGSGIGQYSPSKLQRPRC